MLLVGARGQRTPDYMYDASGTITSGSAPQLVLAQSKTRSMLVLQNLHASATMYVEIGSARATATLSGNSVASCSITNAGFGFTKPPRIEFLGGGYAGNTSYLGLGQPGSAAPSGTFGSTPSLARPAQGHAVLSGTGTLSSIVIDDGGAGYVTAPYVFIFNDPLDPFGCATPAGPNGILLPPNGGSYYNNGTCCTTDPVSIFCTTATAPFTCKWMA